MDNLYSIIEPLRDLSIVDLEANGFQCVDRERAAAYLSELKRSIVEALDDENEYSWHDLRKNPDDVPDSDRKVECRTMTAKGVVNPIFGYYDNRWCCGMNSNVIAWREIEPFE